MLLPLKSETQTVHGVYWPVPPFFKLATARSPADRVECDLDLGGGRVLRGEELVEFEPGTGSVGVRRPQPHGIKRIDLAKIRSIKMTRPGTYVADSTALGAVGARERGVENQKPFVVVFVDGSQAPHRSSIWSVLVHRFRSCSPLRRKLACLRSDKTRSKRSCAAFWI